LIFLTKAEVFLAAFVGALAGFACLLWSMNQTPVLVRKRCALLAACGLAPVAFAAILLSRSLPFADVLSALAASWKWLGDSNLTQMYYFRWMMGTDDPWRSVQNMAAWSGVYLSLLAVSGGIAIATRAKPQAAKAAVAVIIAVALAAPVVFFWDRIPWRGFLRPLPVAMLGILIVLIVQLRRAPRDVAGRFVLPISFTMFSLMLLAKMALYAHSNHYGFALSMPATMVFAALLVSWAPDWIGRRFCMIEYSGRGFAVIVSSRVPSPQPSPGVLGEGVKIGASSCIVRAAMIAALLAAAYAHIRINQAWIARRVNLVSSNGDSFYAAEYGKFTQQTIDFINVSAKPTDSLVCMPEGLLINFMTRRVNPTPDMNFNPPSLVMYGEENMLARLKEHPPDWIALVGEDTSVYGPRFFGRDYGVQIARWIHDEYEPAQLFGAPPFVSKDLGILIMRHRSGGPS
jgi:hypothetical protein